VESTGVVVGTEAVLHRVPDAGLVALLDVDAELLAPRYRATEEALGLVVAAGRLVGGRRRGGGSVLVQTRLPDHPVIAAAVAADPGALVESTWAQRRLLGDPPAATVAVVAREGAAAFIERFGDVAGVERLGPDESGQWLLRSEDQRLLLDALAAVDRPPGRLRLWVDPVRTR
jgi:primosomal protein N' (replication factor Y)